MINTIVHSQEQLAEAIEKIGEEDTRITLRHKHGVTHYKFSPLLALNYYERTKPEYIRNAAIRAARHVSSIAAYMEHLKQLAKKIRKMPRRTFA